MKALILAAGYATRLYPLTLDQPKPLLKVGGKAMMEWVIEKLLPVGGGLDHCYVVTNEKFTPHFERWAAQYHCPGLKFSIINDGTNSDANKLGAIGDMHLVLKSQGIDDDLIVVAGDNLFSESLADFGRVCREKQQPILAVYDVGDLEQIKKYNSITLDAAGQITFFEEKPQQPTSTLTGIALYYYPRQSLKYIHQYIAEGNNPDQPGRLVQWMYSRTPVFTWRVPGQWFDIGSKETLAEADQVFSALPQR